MAAANGQEIRRPTTKSVSNPGRYHCEETNPNTTPEHQDNRLSSWASPCVKRLTFRHVCAAVFVLRMKKRCKKLCNGQEMGERKTRQKKIEDTVFAFMPIIGWYYR
jgi:hypothetical protein